MSKKSQIIFDVQVDENKVPTNIKWSASDSDKGSSSATLISIWEAETQNTLKLDLWTKDMKVDEMNLFFYQTLLTMSETFGRATSNESLSKDLKDFADYFGRKSKVITGENTNSSS